MSDMDLEHSGLQEVANAVRGDVGAESNSSQKRKRDPSDQGVSADGTRGLRNKRLSPNDSGDPSVESLQDFTNHGNTDQNGGSDNAAATAAAALGGVYPTMTIPQPTDLSFATQDSEERNDPSFMPDSQDDRFMNRDMHTTTPMSGRSTGKPAVGSDEWHKVRKDNHKEGKLCFSRLLVQWLILCS